MVDAVNYLMSSSRVMANRSWIFCCRSSDGRGQFTSRLLEVVPINLLATLVAFLCLNTQRRDGPRIKPPQADRLAGFLAITVCSVLDALQRRINFRDQFTLAIARA